MRKPKPLPGEELYRPWYLDLFGRPRAEPEPDRDLPWALARAERALLDVREALEDGREADAMTVVLDYHAETHRPPIPMKEDKP